MKRLIILFALAIGMYSCGIYSKYKPQTEVPKGLFGAADTLVASDTASLGNLSWRSMFTDPQLQALIEKGLQNNTNLQTAHLKIQEAEAALMSSRLSYLPAFALAPEGAISSFDHGRATKTYSLPITASWEVDIFGRLTNAKRRSKAAYLQSQEYAQAVQTQLIAGIANSYYTLLMLDAQYEIAKSTEASWQESVRTTRAMKGAGMVTEAALAQTEATYFQIRTTLLDLEEQIEKVENALSLLLADVPQRIQRGRLDAQHFPEKVSVGVPLQMLSRRPDVKSAELALAQAFYTTNAARSAFYPSLVLGGSLGWTNSAGAYIINPGKLLATAFGSLTAPLFNKGMNRAQLKIAKAQQEEARLNFTQTLLNAGSEVNDALTQYQTAVEKSAWYEKQVQSLLTAEKSTRLLMQHSNTTYLEVLVAQQTLLNAQLTQVSNQFARIQGLINLYQALGGGTE
ncbi:MAG: TolC family protein [Oscillibacter sp.]|nr:TolC family protein [Oscillibacter sp.]